jgi:hypothetical protein
VEGDRTVKPRDQITLQLESGLKAIIRAWDNDTKSAFGFDINQFLRNYRETSDDLRLESRFDFTVLKEDKARHHDRYGSYRLFQVHLEPKGQYRLVIVRSDQLDDLWGIWAFKKTRMSEKKEITAAIKQAEVFWRRHWSK